MCMLCLGEELKKCTKLNYYEIAKIAIKDIKNIDILSKNMIFKAYNNEYIEL